MSCELTDETGVSPRAPHFRSLGHAPTSSGCSKGRKEAWPPGLGLSPLAHISASPIQIKSTSLLYYEMNTHSNLYRNYCISVFEHCFVASCHSSPENVFQSLAYCIKSRTQVNKVFFCLDSCLPDDNPFFL